VKKVNGRGAGVGAEGPLKDPVSGKRRESYRGGGKKKVKKPSNSLFKKLCRGHDHQREYSLKTELGGRGKEKGCYMEKGKEEGG